MRELKLVLKWVRYILELVISVAMLTLGSLIILLGVFTHQYDAVFVGVLILAAFAGLLYVLYRNGGVNA